MNKVERYKLVEKMDKEGKKIHIWEKIKDSIKLEDIVEEEKDEKNIEEIHNWEKIKDLRKLKDTVDEKKDEKNDEEKDEKAIEEKQ